MPSKKSKYDKVDPREHVLKRPNMYIGSIELDTYNTWVYNADHNSMEKRNIKYVPGLYKIYDEILINAIDHYVRMREEKNLKKRVNLVKNIRIEIDREAGTVIVENDGDGIEIEKHPEHNVWNPELIFGHMLTSSNFDDNEEKIIGGQNGIGAKACNIFSVQFKVTTVDKKNKKRYTQIFSDNMTKISDPVIEPCVTSPCTRIEFLPDYKLLRSEGLDEDMFQIMKKRAYDSCAVTGDDVSIYFNGTKLEYKNFKRYVDLYLGDERQHNRVHEIINENWEVVASYNESGGFDQISFVNGLWTIKGGKHVDHVVNQITKKLIETINKKKKNVVIKPQTIRDNLIIFVKATVVNPTFDSQSKETLTTPVSKFGEKVQISENFIKKLAKTGIIERVLEINQVFDNKSLQKTDGKKRISVRGLPQLDDANWAGGLKSSQCTLILTEGNSAQTMAITGIGALKNGRDIYGVFPLKGKLMNVLDAAVSKVGSNEEINNLKKILGLESGKKYVSTEMLRYGKIMAMTDQDSVTGDTPLFLKNKQGKIQVKTIENISENFETIGDKEYGNCDDLVWTDGGWTEIRHVMRHKTTKKIYRILTHIGIVDVTEDHSLLKENGDKISPSECQINDNLLHSFPTFKENEVILPANLEKLKKSELFKYASRYNVQYYEKLSKTDLIAVLNKIDTIPKITLTFSSDITIDEAWVMGLFWADGTSGVNRWLVIKKKADRPNESTYYRTSYNWSIFNKNRYLLEKASKIMHNIYSLDFKIIQQKSKSEQPYKLIINGGIKTKHIVEKYSDMFYYMNSHKYKKGNKIIHHSILNSERSVRLAFLDGYYCGRKACLRSKQDGFGHDIDSKSLGMDIEGKISAQSLYCLLKSLGYLVSINHQTRKPNVYTFDITREKQQGNPNKIKKIWNLGTSEQFVYDLETINHHFQAGIGQMVVHNTDGSHIKGLLFNMFWALWPELLKINTFITSMNTPIVKVFYNNQVVAFYNQQDYDAWLQVNRDITHKSKYYKGLGTSNDEEAQEYFRNLKQVIYLHDGEASDKSINLAFNKKQADDRKLWLGNYDKNNTLDYNADQLTYSDFINKELIHFSTYDVARSIPSLCDGLKVSQRKILWSCFKRNLTNEIKVAQLSGYVSEKAAYHHGEASLQGAIIGMAQNYVGSNNINLLEPRGQFGSRRNSGKDSASPRYIFTCLSSITRNIFIKDDDNVLEYLQDDGELIEPECYYPIIPMILINGGLGIGTGFSTSVSCYKPEEVIDTMIDFIDNAGNAVEKVLAPWYNEFTGIIENRDGKWVSKGRYEKIAPNKIKVTELPIGYWTIDFKEHVEQMIEKGTYEIKNYESQSKTTTIDEIITFNNAEICNSYLEIEKNGYTKMENQFKLVSSKNLATTNMYLFDHKKQITKYQSVHDIFKAFYHIRYDIYQKRKEAVIRDKKDNLELLQNKLKFVQDVVSGKIAVFNIKRNELIAQLDELVFIKYEKSYDYLLKIPIYNLTIDMVEKLQNELIETQNLLHEYELLSIKSIWLNELNHLSTVIKASKKQKIGKELKKRKSTNVK